MVFKSLVALLNISKDTGSVVTSFGICVGPSSTWMGLSIVFVEGVEAVICSHGTGTGGRISSSGVVCGSMETAVGVIIVLFLFLEDVSSDNMGNKEFSVGTLLFKKGTSLIKFPTVEDVREAFLLYHMNIIPRAITHTPMDTNIAKINVGDIERG